MLPFLSMGLFGSYLAVILGKKNYYTPFKVNLAIYNERENKLLFKGNSSGREIGTQNFGNISSVFRLFCQN